MLFVYWKRLTKPLRLFGGIWALIAIIAVISNGASPTSTVIQQTAVKEAEPTAVVTTATSLSPSPTIKVISEPVIVDLTFPSDRFPETAAHIRKAIKNGESAICTIDRAGADDNRDESLKNVDVKSGYDRDEWPMAMCAEGGAGADIAYVTPKDNRGAGSWVGNKLDGYADGIKVHFIVPEVKVAIETVAPKTPEPTNEPVKTPEPVIVEEIVYYASCSAVRDAGADPVYEGDPGYSRKLDRDGDGVGCEK
ncbi:excalibur calcium-binding domain-containing protein [Paenibacillus sp. LPE1-1-1.1]